MRLKILSLGAIGVLMALGFTVLTVGQGSTVYNPYPPGILPANLSSEIARVQREIAGIETEAIAEWHALPPITFTGQPPTIQGSGYNAVRALGKLMNFDLNISPSRNVACASCHMPYSGFSGPIPSVNLTTIAYPGSFHFRFGKRPPPSDTRIHRIFRC